MTNCYFCGSNIETMPEEVYFKDRPHLKMDRYFVDVRDGKDMCKLCGQHFIQRNYIDSLPEGQEGDTEDFMRFIEKNFKRVFVLSNKKK